MIREKADDLLTKYEGKLVGKENNGSTVDAVVIVPRNVDNIFVEILERVKYNVDYDDLLDGYNDFDVNVFYDLKYYFDDGFLIVERIDEALEKFKLN